MLVLLSRIKILVQSDKTTLITQLEFRSVSEYDDVREQIILFHLLEGLGKIMFTGNSRSVVDEPSIGYTQPGAGTPYQLITPPATVLPLGVVIFADRCLTNFSLQILGF